MRYFDQSILHAALAASLAIGACLTAIGETASAQNPPPNRKRFRSDRKKQTPRTRKRRRTNRKSTQPQRVAGKTTGFVVRKVGVIHGDSTQSQLRRLVTAKLGRTTYPAKGALAPERGTVPKLKFPFTLTAKQLARRGLGSISAETRGKFGAIYTSGTPRLVMAHLDLSLQMQAGRTYLVDLHVGGIAYDQLHGGTFKVTQSDTSKKVVHATQEFELKKTRKAHIVFAVLARKNGRGTISVEYFAQSGSLYPFTLFSCKVDKLNPTPIP